MKLLSAAFYGLIWVRQKPHWGYGYQMAGWGAVRFPEWGEVLAQLKIGDAAKAAVRQGVYAYLRWCKQKRTFACIATAKSYISEVEAAGNNPGKPALRWFFEAAWQHAQLKLKV